VDWLPADVTERADALWGCIEGLPGLELFLRQLRELVLFFWR
jgi:hypothetical protein